MKYAIFQTEIIPADPEANEAQIRQWTENTVQMDKPDTIMLPELWNTGYALDSLAEKADMHGERTKAFLGNLAKIHSINIIGGSVGNKKNGKLFNSSFVFNRGGELVYEYDKIHLVPMLNEHQFLDGGEKKAEVFELDGVKMGLITCYDLRFPELARQLALEGANVLHIIAQWPKARKDHWRHLQLARAIENQQFIISCNTVGYCGDTEFAGNSMVIGPWGNELAFGGPSNKETITIPIDLSIVPQIREDVPVFTSRVPKFYK
ncbi:carbon-nitrogen family hydrolase [Virgibacillus sp. YIM 98842]|uniref:carbon-nitrogen family hydrolase n=1 Tax=Virgibacillus sp. YIM 98842 TaxID=2663533 RepID=UPI0013D913B7|nr:carbon-nitrogen family hydrolase [Virgibacillus sp. YIM 98842]